MKILNLVAILLSVILAAPDRVAAEGTAGASPWQTCRQTQEWAYCFRELVSGRLSEPGTPVFKTVTFEIGASELTLENKAMLDQLVVALADSDAAPESIELIGHTDSSGSAVSNIELSARRAASVRDYLISRGAPMTSVKIYAKGESEALTGSADMLSRVTDRRVDLLIRQDLNIGTSLRQ